MAAAPPRGHEFTATRFHVPTWCTQCKSFVRNPFGKQGYHCHHCHAHIHKGCLAAASATPCVHTPRHGPILPLKMIGARLTERKEKVAAIEALASMNKKVLQAMIGDLQGATPGHDLHHITKAAFLKVLPKYLNGPVDVISDLLWEMCESDDGTADVKDVVSVFALLSAGSPAQKLELLFRLYDGDEDGVLDEPELRKLCAFLEARVQHWLSDDAEYRDEAIASVRALQDSLLEDAPDEGGVTLAAWLSEASKFRTVQPLLERLQAAPSPGVLGHIARQIRYPSFEAWMAEHTPPPLYEDEWDATLTTGSVMLAAGGEAVSKLIMKSTWSTWSHAAFIVRDPPADVRAKYGVEAAERFFVFESDTVTFDNRKGGGVQLVPLRRWLEVEMEDCKVDGRAVVRVLRVPGVSVANEWTALGELKDFMLEVHGEAYKKSKWQLAGSAVRANRGEDLSSIFCSELVAAGLRAAGLLGPGRHANNFLPKDFESGAPAPIALLRGASLAKELRFYRHKPAPKPAA